jgi:flagellar hook-length control protein FliK
VIADALVSLAAPATPAPAAGADPVPADLAAMFLNLLQAAAPDGAGSAAGEAGASRPEGGRLGRPPGDGKPRAKGARTAQSEGADTTDTDSAGPVAPQTDPLAAALLQVSLPVPTSGAPTHTDDAQGQGAGAHMAESIVGGADAARPSDASARTQGANLRVGMSQLPHDAAVDATRLAAGPVAGTAAPARTAPQQLGGTAAVGTVGLAPTAARGATDPAAPSEAAAPKKPVHRHAGTSAVTAAREALHAAAARTVAAAPSVVGAVDAPSAPTGHADGQSSTPTAHARLGELPHAAAAVLEVATQAKATRARIVLTPPELGKVEIRLRYGADGVSATFHADSAEAAQTLTGAAGDLRRSLETQGIQVVRIDVPFTAAASSDQQGSPWLGGGDADPNRAHARGGHQHTPDAPTTGFQPDDQSTLRTVLLGTAVDVLA